MNSKLTLHTVFNIPRGILQILKSYMEKCSFLARSLEKMGLDIFCIFGNSQQHQYGIFEAPEC